MINYEQIYLFTGTDDVRKKTKMDRIITSITSSNDDVDIIKYDAETTSLTSIISEAITIPFLKDLKIIQIKNPNFINTKDSTKSDINLFIKYLKKPMESTVMIIDAVNMTIDSSSPIYQILTKTAYIIDTKELDDIEYEGWVQRYFVKENVTISNDAINLLLKYVKKNLVRMEQEINKLVSFVGPGGKITEDDVKNIVCNDLDGYIFDFTNAIVSKNRKLAYEYYNNFSHNTQDVSNLVGMLAKTLIELLTTLKLLKEGYSQNDVATILKISNNKAFYLVKDVKKFKLEVLEEYVDKCSTLDYQIKAGLIDKNLGLEMFLLEI